MSELPKLVKVHEIEVPIQNIIVNGERHTTNVKVPCIVCPSCGNVLYQYPKGANVLEAFRHISTNKEDFCKVFKYCSQCGQKLSFDSFDVVEEKNG